MIIYRKWWNQNDILTYRFPWEVYRPVIQGFYVSLIQLCINQICMEYLLCAVKCSVGKKEKDE